MLRKVRYLLKTDVKLVRERIGATGLGDEVVDSLAQRHDQGVKPGHLVSNGGGELPTHPFDLIIDALMKVLVLLRRGRSEQLEILDVRSRARQDPCLAGNRCGPFALCHRAPFSWVLQP